MSTDTIPDERPVDPDDELLVAYLDGELTSEERADVEQRLMDDELLRSRLQSLQRGWDWLDEMPDFEPSEKLVESTMELVVADFSEPERKQNGGVAAKLRWPLLVTLASLCGAAVTWSGISASREQAYQSQLRDLEIAENLDAYLSGSNLQLMRELMMNPTWDEMVASARAIGYTQVDLTSSIADVPQREREASIAEMPVEDRTKLASRWDRFSRLSDDLQRVRQTAAAVAVQPDHEALLKTMRVYAVWRETLPSELRAEVESEDISERKQAITKAIEFTKTEVSRRSGNILPDGAEEPILWMLRRIADQRLSDLPETVRGFFEQRGAEFGNDEVRYEVVRRILFRDDPRWDRFRRGAPGGSGPGGSGPGGAPSNRMPTLAPISDEELLMIKPTLSSYGLDKEFYELTFGDPQYEVLVLRAWAEEALRRATRNNDEEQISMLDRYLELDARERAVVDLKSPKEILSRLTPASRGFRGPPPSSGFGSGFGGGFGGGRGSADRGPERGGPSDR